MVFKGNQIMGLFYLLFISFAAIFVFTEIFVGKTTGTLTRLKNISEMKEFRKSRYYTLDNYYIDKTRVCFYSRSEIPSKSGRLYFNICAIMPIYDSATVRIEPDCAIWLGVKYSQFIDINASAAAKKQAYQNFKDEAMEDFNSDTFNHFYYLMRLSKSPERNAYMNTFRRQYSYNTDNITFLTQGTEPFELRGGNSLMVAGITLLSGIVLACLALLIPGVNQAKLQERQQMSPQEPSEF